MISIRFATLVGMVLLGALGLTGDRPQSVDPTALDRRLLQAATSGDAASVQYLLKQGANLEAKDDNGSTPLILAAENRHIEVVNLLLEKGANVGLRTTMRGRPWFTLPTALTLTDWKRCFRMRQVARTKTRPCWLR